MLAITRWLVVVCLMVSIGLHTVVIQSAAWAGMLVSYSVQKGSMLEAVEDTFDGAHPCPLCKLAQKTAEKPAASTDTTTSSEEGPLKMHLIADTTVPLLFAPPPMRERLMPADQHANVLAATPDTPPPRCVHLG